MRSGWYSVPRRHSFDPVHIYSSQKFTIMKKAFAYGLTGFFLPWTITSITYSQNSTNPAGFQGKPSIEKIIPTPKQPDTAGKTEFNFRNEISSSAVRNFLKDYKDVTNAKWSKMPHGYSAVVFTVDSIKTRIVYDKGGQCENIVRYYFENRLPPAVRHLVKSTYYDFSIYHIIEPTLNGVTSYLVKMEGKTTWKTVKVVDGEIEEVEECFKVK
jgi:hypothetical protein